jgi:hypothetical protein
MLHWCSTTCLRTAPVSESNMPRHCRTPCDPATPMLAHCPTAWHRAGTDGEGIHEDTIDTLHMVRHSVHLGAVLLTDMACLLGYNYMGMHVTGHLGAVFRTVLETMRTLFVWLAGLALFYLGTGLGESWDAYSFVQALGFFVLVTGTVVYGRGDEQSAAKVSYTLGSSCLQETVGLAVGPMVLVCSACFLEGIQHKNECCGPVPPCDWAHALFAADGRMRVAFRCEQWAWKTTTCQGCLVCAPDTVSFAPYGSKCRAAAPLLTALSCLSVV